MQSRRKRVVPLSKRRWYSLLKSLSKPQNFIPVLLFLVQITAMVSCIAASYRAKGDGGITLGVVGILTIFCCIAGLIVSSKGLKKRKTEKFWCYLGLILQLLYLLIIIGIFITGVISLIG